MTHIGIIIGSTRPGRKADAVARWIHGIAAERDDATYEIVDIADYGLPLLDEEAPAAMGPQYGRPHTQEWSATVASFDAYIFVTPEYNHSISGALKNAIDFLYTEWNDKAAGFVSYGVRGGTHAAEHLRLIMGELKVADVRTQVALSIFDEFTDGSEVKEDSSQVAILGRMLDELSGWAAALRALRLNPRILTDATILPEHRDCARLGQPSVG